MKCVKYYKIRRQNGLPSWFAAVNNNLLDNSIDIYLIVYGLIRSDRLIIQGPCVAKDEGFTGTFDVTPNYTYIS